MGIVNSMVMTAAIKYLSIIVWGFNVVFFSQFNRKPIAITAPYYFY